MKQNPLARNMGITKVAVIGAGTMGSGIAQVCAQTGWQTVLYDAFPEGLERGMQRIDAFWSKGIERGKEMKHWLYPGKLLLSDAQ